MINLRINESDNNINSEEILFFENNYDTRLPTNYILERSVNPNLGNEHHFFQSFYWMQLFCHLPRLQNSISGTFFKNQKRSESLFLPCQHSSKALLLTSNLKEWLGYQRIQ